jgi:DNA helicase II / ATP-dependent DNA helicase PcrA
VTQQAGGGDRHVYAGRSRFISEAMVGQFECATWPEAAAADAPALQPQAPIVQVRNRARAAWR